jgi:hypothetical protein
MYMLLMRGGVKLRRARILVLASAGCVPWPGICLPQRDEPCRKEGFDARNNSYGAAQSKFCASSRLPLPV